MCQNIIIRLLHYYYTKKAFFFVLLSSCLKIVTVWLDLVLDCLLSVKSKFSFLFEHQVNVSVRGDLFLKLAVLSQRTSPVWWSCSTTCCTYNWRCSWRAWWRRRNDSSGGIRLPPVCQYLRLLSRRWRTRWRWQSRRSTRPNCTWAMTCSAVLSVMTRPYSTK